MTDMVVALRVKNEARWIGEVLDAVNWAKAVYLMDDHSTDGTGSIAKSHGVTVLDSPFQGFDEARDKDWLVEQVAKENADGTWVLMQDGDEVLEVGGREKMEQEIKRSPTALAFSIGIKFLWDSREQYRVDGVYGRFRRPSLFLLTKNRSFRRSGVNGNLHPSCVPAFNRRACRPCSAALLHLGYMERADRIRKWKFYNGMDPVNKTEGYDPKHPERGSYPHIVQGDVPEVPAHVKLLHAGPLELRCL